MSPESCRLLSFLNDRVWADDPLLVSKSNADLLEPISTRSSRVHDFLRLTNPRLEYDVVAIQDVYGPTAWEEDIQALVVSKESVGGGKMSEFRTCFGAHIAS